MNKEKEKALKELAKSCDNKLEKYVIDDCLQKDEPINYIKDVLQHGCVSGIVSGLIYYNDTKKFFNEYQDEIEELKEEIEENTGEPLKIGYPLTNWLAWFGYEEATRKVADKIELEY